MTSSVQIDYLFSENMPRILPHPPGKQIFLGPPHPPPGKSFLDLRMAYIVNVLAKIGRIILSHVFSLSQDKQELF